MLLNSTSARQFGFIFRHLRSFTIPGLVLLAQLLFADAARARAEFLCQHEAHGVRNAAED